MVESKEIESKIKELIEKFVSNHWETKQSVCYLSAIGLYLNAEIPDFRVAFPMGLREFLRQNPVVQVVQFPGVEQKIGAVPMSVTLPDDVGGLFAARSQPSVLKRQRPAYVQDFWDAFCRPIEGHSRYVVIDEEAGRVTVRDELPDEDSGFFVYEITRQDLSDSLPNESIASKVEATHSAIDSWLEKQSLEPRAFARPRRQRRDIVVGSRLVSLIGAFDGLPDEDLARMSIPLDILIKLNSKDDD